MFTIKVNEILRREQNSECPGLGACCAISLIDDSSDSGDETMYGIPADGTKYTVELGKATGYFGGVLEDCLGGMKRGETHVISVDFTHRDFQKPCMLTFTLELHSFTDGKCIYELTVKERLRQCNLWRTNGNCLFVKSNYCMAGYWYSKALKYGISCTVEECDQEEKSELKETLCNCYTNLAACQLKRKFFNHAVDNCTKVLSIDPQKIKALYRRALAYVALEMRELAIKDLKIAATVEPKNSAVVLLYKSIQ